MKLEKREVTLNEKDSLLDMALFERFLQDCYRNAAEIAQSKEAKCLLAQKADELNEWIHSIYALRQREPKM